MLRETANQTPEQTDMDCLVVGGIADGVLLRHVKLDASIIELGRPTYLKPLERPDQPQPEAERETQTYHVYTQIMPNADNFPVQVGIAVPEDQSLWEAFALLVVRYVQQVSREQMEQAKTEIHH